MTIQKTSMNGSVLEIECNKDCCHYTTSDICELRGKPIDREVSNTCMFKKYKNEIERTETKIQS